LVAILKDMRINIKIISFGIVTLLMNMSCWSQKKELNSRFYDFITEFSQREAKQADNILFPLLLISDSDTSYIQKSEWKNINYCFGCEYSPMLFMGDSIDYYEEFYTMKGENDYMISAYIKPDNRIQNFCFSRIKDSWFLTKIEAKTISNIGSESFFEFINMFSSDTSFMKTRIKKDTKYITWVENPNELIESPLDLIEFEGENYLFERIYINNINFNADNVVIYIKGEGTGYHLEYYFNRINGKWYLKKLVNIGV